MPVKTAVRGGGLKLSFITTEPPFITDNVPPLLPASMTLVSALRRFVTFRLAGVTPARNNGRHAGSGRARTVIGRPHI